MSELTAVALPTGAACMVVAAYLLGGVPFGVLIARAKGVNIRAAGSGNIGAANVGRVLGRKFFLFCFLLDIAKGLVPVLVMGWLLRSHRIGTQDSPVWARDLAWIAVATAAVLGHVFSIFIGFKGGKGVATSLGVLLGIYHYYTIPGLAAFGVWCLVTLISRYISVGSIVASATFVGLYVLRTYYGPEPLLEHWPMLACGIVLAGVIILRHRANIRRLLKGTESKIGAAPPKERGAEGADE